MPQTNEVGYEEKMGNSSVASSYEGLCGSGNDDDDQAKSEQRAIITNNEIDRIVNYIDDITEMNFSDYYENFHGGYKRKSKHRWR